MMLRGRATLRVLACVVWVLLLTGIGAVPATGQSRTPSGDGSSGTELKKEYDDILGAEAKIEQAIDAQSVRMVEVAAQIDQLGRHLAEVDLQVVAAGRGLRRAVAVDAAARAELKLADARVRRSTQTLRDQAVSAYIGGGSAGPSIEVLLSSFGGATQNGQASSYAGVLVDHQRAVIVEYRSAKAARAKVSARAVKTREGAQQIRDAVAASQRELQIKRVEMEALKEEAGRAAALQLAARTKLLSKKIEIEARITNQEKASDGIALTLFAAQSGEPDYVPGSITFAPPIPGAKPGSPFGMRFHPILHYARLHAGMDIGAGAGTPIHAAADGVVLIAGPRGGYGNAVVIDHGFGIATVYAHQSRIVARVGQQVKLGDVIGAVGSTGLSTGPHLHFETRVRGIPVNPTSFVNF